MSFKWTPVQEKAIKLRNKNILVSAAAGSGKTAVLVERIKRLIIEDKKGIDRMLIVTFTNAAAAEMKEKIVKAIETELEVESENGQFLRKQLDNIVNAQISTFHAFALDIMRRYFQLIDVEPDFSVGDPGDVEVLMWEAVDEMFEDRFEADDEDFIDILKCYSNDRNDMAFKKMLIGLYAKLMAIPEPFDWLSENIAMFDTDKAKFTESKWMKDIKHDIAELLIDAEASMEKAFEMVSTAGLEGLASKNQSDLESIRMLRKNLETCDWDKFRELVFAVKFKTMAAKKTEKGGWDEIKAAVGEQRDAAKTIVNNIIRDQYVAVPLEDMVDDIKATDKAARVFEGIIIELHERFRAKKKEQNIVDFTDAEHYALRILSDDKVCAEYHEKFEYIFIDEYQDSNILQDTLIKRIRRDDNVFMVGDVKQSIYKFRLAEPEIFQTKYKEFKNSETGFDAVIDLNKNFRSKEPVIRAVNTVFGRIMDDYDEDAALYCGDDYAGVYQPETELYLIDESRDEEDKKLTEDVLLMKRAEIEANAAAEIINGAVGQKFHDSKEGCDREFRKKDIVILMRSVKEGDIWQQVLSERGIPSYIEASSGYFDTVEVAVFLDLMTIIDNFRQDVPLLSVMRSMIGGFSIDEMIEIRLLHKRGAYYDAFFTYMHEGEDVLLRNKCRAFYEKIENFREFSRGMLLEEFVWHLLDRTGLYIYTGGMINGRQRQANLRALADKAFTYKNVHGESIYGFLTYINAIKNKDLDVGQVKLLGENDDVVRIMTIHKSKGLEFPMVIAGGLGKISRGKAESKRGIKLHKDIGVGMARADYEEMWYKGTAVQTLIKNREKMEDDAESVRLLYVAFTRARDRLVLTGAVKDVEKQLARYNQLEKIPQPETFLDMVGPACSDAGIKICTYDRGSVVIKNDQESVVVESVEDIRSFDPVEEEKLKAGALYKEIDRRLSFTYKYADDCKKKSKYSATELNKNAAGVIEPEDVKLRTPRFMSSKVSGYAAAKGTAIHIVMEHIDFKEALSHIEKGTGCEYIKGVMEDLKNDGIIDSAIAEKIDPDAIAGFFDTGIGKRAAQADLLVKEASFNFMQDIEGTEVMVQGIIDCYFKDKDGFVLIDYKSDFVNLADHGKSVSEIREKYRVQMEIYKEALEKITGEQITGSYLYLFSSNEIVKMAI